MRYTTVAIEIGRVARKIRTVCQMFGLKTPERIMGRETSLQSSRRELMSVSPGGTFLDN